MEPEIRIYPSVTSPLEVLRVPVAKLHNFNIHGSGSFEVGNSGFVYGEGEPVSAGGNWGFTWSDFKKINGDIVVYAAASSPVDIVVTTWRDY
jgi:hypothetical protein